MLLVRDCNQPTTVTSSSHVHGPLGLADHIGVARGCTGCTCTPPPGRRNNFFLGQIYSGKLSAAPDRETESAPLEAEQESNFWGNWGDVDGGRAYLGSFSVCFEGDDYNKGRQLFWGKKSASPDKILATPMADQQWGSTIWNKLSQDLQSTDTMEQFKRRLKGWLFECPYTAVSASDRHWLKARLTNGLTYLLACLLRPHYSSVVSTHDFSQSAHLSTKL